MQSSKPETKHSSALVRSAVSKNESKCILSIFSANTLQNSVLVVYACDVSVEIGLLRGMVSFVLSGLHCASALTKVRLRRSVPKQLVAHVRPELFCYIEKRIQGDLLSPLIRGISK